LDKEISTERNKHNSLAGPTTPQRVHRIILIIKNPFAVVLNDTFNFVTGIPVTGGLA
jgi:hypothetical protein